MTALDADRQTRRTVAAVALRAASPLLALSIFAVISFCRSVERVHRETPVGWDC
jgi:hypothetical protein